MTNECGVTGGKTFFLQVDKKETENTIIIVHFLKNTRFNKYFGSDNAESLLPLCTFCEVSNLRMFRKKAYTKLIDSLYLQPISPLNSTANRLSQTTRLLIFFFNSFFTVTFFDYLELEHRWPSEILLGQFDLKTCFWLTDRAKPANATAWLWSSSRPAFSCLLALLKPGYKADLMASPPSASLEAHLQI